MTNIIKIFFIGIFGCSLMFIAGCVSLRSQDDVAVRQAPQTIQEGIYHKVTKGETLWRIAKAYNISVDEVTRANNILKAAKIEEGQLVFIPGAKAPKEIVFDTDQTSDEFVWPIHGKVIKYFHVRYGNQMSKGIDIKARIGDEVKATRTGQVVFADYLSGYGYTVILDHLDGFHSVYAQNSKLLVKLGEKVFQNGAIAQVGHHNHLAYLHFQIRKQSIEDNPLYYLP